MYKIPGTLADDINYIGKLINDFNNGTIPAAQFKAIRVPMGIYEQRKDGTYMVRIRCTGGFISPEQLREVAHAATYGNIPHLHITTRQEIQLHYVSLTDVRPILEELKEAGLGTKGGGGNTIRNILVDINAGISADEVFDVYPYAVDLTTRLIAENDSFTMPRKLKIAFDISEERADYALVNDLGFIPKIKNGKRGFKVYLGGSVASSPTLGWLLFDFLPEEDILRVAIAAKRFFSANGNRKNRHKARIRHIFYKLGEEETIRLFNTYFEETKADESLAYVPSELAFTTLIPSFPAIENQSSAYLTWKKRYSTEQKQKGLYAILLPFEHGNASPGNFLKLAEFAAEFGNNVLRFTTRQNLQLRNIPEAYLPNVYQLLAEIGLNSEQPFLVNNLISCTGADTCRLGICLAKNACKALWNKLAKSNLDLDQLTDLKINITGCSNSCAQQIWSDIGFAGRVSRNENMYPSYTVYAKTEGKTQLGQALGVISSRDLPDFTVDVLTTFLEKKDSYTSFNNFLEQDGKNVIGALLNKYQDIPLFNDDKNYYYDWGSEDVFSLTARGKAECSAGLFDMIDLDAKIIEDTIKVLESETSEKKINALLYDLVYSSSRMLLITRGAEPRTIEDTFNLFNSLFIEAGLVDQKFKAVVETAKKKGDLLTQKETAFQLADVVVTLYKNMDDSLQFKNVKTAEPVESPVENKAKEVITTKDFRGVGCPMNFVKTKLALSPLSSGDLLEVWLDNGAPIENVPGSVRNEGHSIISETQVQDYWKVIIKKK